MQVPGYPSLKEVLGKLHRLICFTGIDGSGKTTHAFSVAKSLNERGLAFEYTWCRWRRTISYPITLLISLIFMTQRGNFNIHKIKSDFIERKTLYLQNKAIRKIWPYLVLLDLIIIYFYEIKLRVLLGRSVICDRYIWDWMADLYYDGICNNKLERMLLRLFPTPHTTFVLDVYEECALARKNDMDSLKRLGLLRVIYLKIANKYHLTIINNEEDEFAAVNKKILEELFKNDT